LHYSIRLHSDDLETKKTVLVCPLNWGLGHATRCVPLIETLQQRGFHVILAATGRARAFLELRFPEISCIDFPDYQIRIPRSGRLISHLLLKFPVYLWRVRTEHQRLKALIGEHKVDVVISDNRYGLWTKKVHCIFITHQLMVKCPPWLRFAEGMVHKGLLHFVKKFDECWIPDSASAMNLSGDLSHKYKLPENACFTGHMSRFKFLSATAAQDAVPTYEILAVVSGPEPQRSQFEELLTLRLNETAQRCCIVRGLPDETRSETYGKTDLIPHAEDAVLASLIRNAELIICRPGYSTLMDLLVLRKNALLIPTPGQTEQEYLGRRMKDQGYFISITQQDLKTMDLKHIIDSFGNKDRAVIAPQLFQIPDTSPLVSKQR